MFKRQIKIMGDNVVDGFNKVNPQTPRLGITLSTNATSIIIIHENLLRSQASPIQ